jgi:hypothetical protein
MGRARRPQKTRQGQSSPPATASVGGEPGSSPGPEAAIPAAALSRRQLKRQQRQAQKVRQAAVQYCVMTVVAAGLGGILLALLTTPRVGVAATIALVCLGLSCQYPRQALFGFIIFVPFSGTVIYALGGSSILQLAKDAIYIPALLGVVKFCRRHRQPLVIPPAIKLPLAVLISVCLLTLVVVNGSQQVTARGGDLPILIGLLGLKVLLGYLPLIPCIYYLLRDREDVYRLMRIQVLLILVCCGLGGLQYLLLSTGLCPGTVGEGEDLFKASLEARCLVGGSLLYSPEQGQIRLPGTFNAPWQWGWFLISGSFFAFGTALSDRSPLWRLVGLGALAAIGIMAVLSGQRIALALVPAIVVGLLMLTGQIVNLRRFIPMGLGLAIILGGFMVQNSAVVNAQWRSFEARWQAAPPHVFIWQQFQWAQNQQQGLLGQGVGRGTNAARIFGQTELVESYHPKLLYEIGPLGLLATLALYGTLTVVTFRAYRSIQDPDLRSYGATMWAFVLFISVFPYYYPLDVDPVNVYYWLAAGIVLKLPEIDQRERLQHQLQDGSQGRKLTRREQKRLQNQGTLFE